MCLQRVHTLTEPVKNMFATCLNEHENLLLFVAEEDASNICCCVTLWGLRNRSYSGSQDLTVVFEVGKRMT